MKTVLGCKVWELEPGNEFSFDDGMTWVIVETIADARDNNDIIINYRNEDNNIDTMRCDSMTHVLLDRFWGSN